MSQMILLVEDDEQLRHIFKLALENVGYEILEACNGREALERLEEQSFDLMVLDMLMPAASGETVIKQLEHMPNHAGMPILIVTAYTTFKTHVAGLPNVEFLKKPIQPHELVEAVGNLLGK